MTNSGCNRRISLNPSLQSPVHRLSCSVLPLNILDVFEFSCNVTLAYTRSSQYRLNLKVLNQKVFYIFFSFHFIFTTCFYLRRTNCVPKETPYKSIISFISVFDSFSKWKNIVKMEELWKPVLFRINAIRYIIWLIFHIVYPGFSTACRYLEPAGNEIFMTFF